MSKLQNNRSKNSSVNEPRLAGIPPSFGGPGRGLPAADRSVAIATVIDTDSTSLERLIRYAECPECRHFLLQARGGGK